jgi:hypothetical protein
VLEAVGLGEQAARLAQAAPEAILRGAAVPTGATASRAGLRARLFGRGRAVSDVR